jgi:hypothetical protein
LLLTGLLILTTTWALECPQGFYAGQGVCFLNVRPVVTCPEGFVKTLHNECRTLCPESWFSNEDYCFKPEPVLITADSSSSKTCPPNHIQSGMDDSCYVACPQYSEEHGFACKRTILYLERLYGCPTIRAMG